VIEPLFLLAFFASSISYLMEEGDIKYTPAIRVDHKIKTTFYFL